MLLFTRFILLSMFLFSSCWISLLSGIGLHTSLTMAVQPASTWGSARILHWPSWRSKSHIEPCCHHWVLFVKIIVHTHLPSLISLTSPLSDNIFPTLTSHHSLLFCLTSGFLEREYTAVCTVCVSDCGVLFRNVDSKIFLYVCVCMVMPTMFIVHSGESTFVFACL